MKENFGFERKWQKRWQKARVFEVRPSKKQKFYALEMFPYPSGEGLHMGHVRNYTIVDAVARFKRMQGFNVLYPAGYDAFGLPAENAAIARSVDPAKWTEANIRLMKKQQKTLGFSYDWSKEVITCKPDYYKWNQWLFLQLYKKGLAYKKEAEVNFCPKCQTVLANEQVKEGKCWRCKSEVKLKLLEQWFFKITNYAEQLLKGLDQLEWPEEVKEMQRNWIGKSVGVLIDFKLKGSKEKLQVFTTRPDTLWGVTFLAFSTEHPKLLELVKGTEYEEKVKAFAEKVKRLRFESPGKVEKEGFFIGKYAINPATNEAVPVWVASFVLPDYGTGIVMGVPAHDQRDFEFAKKYNLPIKLVIQLEGKEVLLNQAYEGQGILLSGPFSGMNNKEAIPKIVEWLEQKGKGKAHIDYKLKDWLISRQRYWGTPIPIVYCEKCGTVPVPEKDLPVKLPPYEKVKFGRGNPLESCESWIKTKCPKCGKPARRETDTMDTFVDSSWYFFRYCDPQNKKMPFDPKLVNYWMPVDLYVGGIEHATGHLIYSRFITKVLRDLGIIRFDEPFKRLLCQGMVTLGGVAMSKSRGNVVDPLTIIKKYGVDTLRTFILFTALPEKQLEWSEQGMQGIHRFLMKLYQLKQSKQQKLKDRLALSRLQRLIEKVTLDFENLKFSLAITALIEFVNWFDKQKEKVSKKTFEQIKSALALLLAPVAPHLAEEIWHEFNKSFIIFAKWPKPNEALIDTELEEQENKVEELKQDIKEVLKLIKVKPKKICIYALPGELFYQLAQQELTQEFSCECIVFSAADPNRYDPENRAKKAKPGKPALWIE